MTTAERLREVVPPPMSAQDKLVLIGAAFSNSPPSLSRRSAPVAFPPAKVYQEALFKAGIPATTFISDDVHADFTRLKGQGVRFRGEPAKMGTAPGVVYR